MNETALKRTDALNEANHVIFEQYGENPYPQSITLGRLYDVHYDKKNREYYIYADNGNRSVTAFFTCKSKLYE